MSARDSVVAFDSGPDEFSKIGADPEQENTEIDSYSALDELSGKLGFKDVDDGLMHSVLENDRETIDVGKVISDALNQGIGSFTPEMMMKNLVDNYRNAKHLYGERFLRYVTGHDPEYIERNIRIPEFKRELKQKIEDSIQRLKTGKLIDRDGLILEKGVELASLIMYVEELKELKGKGLSGEKITKRASPYGDRGELRDFRKGDRYRDISVAGSAKRAIRRGHKEILLSDLKATQRMQRGKHELVYALDASGSMRGKKIELAKKAGIALAYHAISHYDKVGLMIFGTRVSHAVAPTNDFGSLLKDIVKARPGQETNIAAALDGSLTLFSHGKHTKHLLIITDALPTVGKDPENLALKATSSARSAGITVSIVGVGLDKKGTELAKRVVQAGEGIFYMASADDAIDQIVLEDYYRLI